MVSTPSYSCAFKKGGLKRVYVYAFHKTLENVHQILSVFIVVIFIQFLDVVQLVQRKSWKVGDIFQAVVQYCKLSEEGREMTPSLFDWLLELG